LTPRAAASSHSEPTCLSVRNRRPPSPPPISPSRRRSASSAGLDRSLATLSGGEITKLALAGALLAAPDPLLLDEPTNNLDAQSVRFLSGWLRGSPAAILLVSHDRALLDDVVDEVLEIHEYDATLALYGGNYTFYMERRRAEFDAAVRQYEALAKRCGIRP
jgi:ATPase subunit of ABC transporter with duplicated ATPase domains